MNQIPTEGLIANYPFNGNANDESGNGNNGTIKGALLTSDRFGNENSAFVFDGIDDVIEVSPSSTINTANMNAISISIWCSMNQNNNYNRLLSFANTTENINIDLSISSENNFVLTNYSGYGADHATFVSENTVDTQIWYHVVAIMNFNEMKAHLYVNGEYLGYDVGTIATKPNNPYIGIGRLFASIPEWLSFDGKLDDISIYNRELNSDEVQTLYSVGGWSSLSQGLVAYYPFKGNANDYSSYGNHGTVFGASLTTDRKGNENNAYNFNGIDNYIYIPNSNSINPSSSLSISFWIMTDSEYQDNKGILGKWNSDENSTPNNEQYAVVLYGNLRFYLKTIGNNQSYVSEGESIHNNGSWNHYLCSWDGNTMKLFVNNELIQSVSYSGTIPNIDQPLEIGRYSSVSNCFFNGNIDDVRIYNRALNESEIESLFNETPLSDIISVDTSTYYVSTLEFEPISPKTYLDKIDTISMQTYDSLFFHYKQFIYNPNYYTDTTYISVTDTLYIDVTLTDVNPPNNINTIKIYPNPANSYITINTGNYQIMSDYTIIIVNIQGQTIFQSLTNESEFQIDVNDFGGYGTYLVKIIDNNNNIIITKKIILY